LCGIEIPSGERNPLVQGEIKDLLTRIKVSFTKKSCGGNILRDYNDKLYLVDLEVSPDPAVKPTTENWVASVVKAWVDRLLKIRNGSAAAN
jgi:hypothetical protein